MHSNKRTPETVTHITHILGLKSILKLHREPVRLPFEPTTNGVHADPADRLERSEDNLMCVFVSTFEALFNPPNKKINETHRTHQKHDDGWWPCSHNPGKVERAEKRRRANKGGQENEDGEGGEVLDRHRLCRVEMVPMPEFVRCLESVRMDSNLKRECVKNVPKTASTSSGLLCWIRVSKITMRLAWKK